MARLQRSSRASYNLRRPTVLKPSIVFGPTKVQTVAVRTAVEQARHKPKSRLRPPPVVVATSVVFAAAPIKVRLARPPQPPWTKYGVGGPTIVGIPAEPVFARIEVRLAPSSRQARVPRTSKLQTPAVYLAPEDLTLAPPLEVRLAKVSLLGRQARYALRPPQVLGDIVVVTPGLALVPVVPGTLTLAPRGRGSYGAAVYGVAVYGEAGGDALALAAADPGVLLLNPR